MSPSAIGPLIGIPSVVAALFASAGCARPSGADYLPGTPGVESMQQASGRVGSHGMVVAGTAQEGFLSHIPMFGAPHDVQLLLAGSFAALTPEASFPASFGEELFTFLPDRMSLDALRTGALHELQGSLFLGNFEAGGRRLPGRFRFAVSRVLHQHLLLEPVVDAGGPPLEYLVFGSRQRTFAAHRLTSAPGFDELLQVKLTGPDRPTDEALGAAVTVRIDEPDAVTARLGVRANPVRASDGTHAVTIERVTELSCLEGPDFVEACPRRGDGSQNL
jgi:hypothetical protein